MTQLHKWLANTQKQGCSKWYVFTEENFHMACARNSAVQYTHKWQVKEVTTFADDINSFRT